MPPNLFHFATKELSQDAFIAWLLDWANCEYKDIDPILFKTAQEFVTELIRKEFPTFNEPISSVSVKLQLFNIDVSAIVNNKYFLLIEDKTTTGQHSDQLGRYKKDAGEHCKQHQLIEPICIYLKTGNESKQRLKKVENKGFKIFGRKDFLRVLNRYGGQNAIMLDFKNHLSSIENYTNGWESKPVEEWRSYEWQGLFLYLDDAINLLDWFFINNENGGFWSAQLNWDYWQKIYPVYIQIEQTKLCFKISTDPAEGTMPNDIADKRTQLRNQLSNLLLNNSQIPSLKRPERFGKGKYMTVACIDQKDWLGKGNGIDKKKIKNTLETCIGELRKILSSLQH